jgi:hypothetical protein
MPAASGVRSPCFPSSLDVDRFEARLPAVCREHQRLCSEQPAGSRMNAGLPSNEQSTFGTQRRQARRTLGRGSPNPRRRGRSRWRAVDARRLQAWRSVPRDTEGLSHLLKPGRCLIAQMIYSEAHRPIPMVCPERLLSFRHRNRDCLASASFGDPDRVARGLDCGWCLEPFLNYRDAGLIAIDGDHGNLAAAILSNE